MIIIHIKYRGFGVGVLDTFGETFLENRQGSDPVETVEDPFQEAGYLIV